jgi:uncharacterized membrane protein
MTPTTVLLLLAAGTYVLKAAGPVALGSRTLPPLLARVVDVLPAPLLAALVAVSLFADGQALAVDARVAGVAAAAVVLARGGGFVSTVLVAGAATALVRAVF